MDIDVDRYRYMSNTTFYKIESTFLIFSHCFDDTFMHELHVFFYLKYIYEYFKCENVFQAL